MSDGRLRDDPPSAAVDAPGATGATGATGVPGASDTNDPRDPRARLRRLLGRARRRIVLRRALRGAGRAVPLGLLPAAVVLASFRLGRERLPLEWTDSELGVFAACVAVAPVILAAALAAWRARRSDLEVALLLDRGWDLRERLTAAVALGSAERASDALASRGGRSLAEAIPWSVGTRRSRLGALGTAGALALLVVAGLLPSLPATASDEGREGASEVEAVTSALAEEASERAAELEEEGADDEALETLDEVRRVAERARLEEVGREEAVAELQRLDQAARREQQRRRAVDAGALERALSSLEREALRRDAMRPAEGGEAASLEQSLASLARRLEEGERFEGREMRRIAARLRDTADALRAAHPDLAEKLEEIAEALESGDLERAERLARELASSGECRRAGGAAGDRALRDARSLLRQAMAALGEAPTDAELGRGDGEGDGRGADGEEGAGARGFASLARDWGVGTTNEEAGWQPLGPGHQQDRQSEETSDWREAYEALHESTSLDEARARSTRVSGQLGEGELVAVETREVSRAAESASAPLVRLPPSYRRASEDALAREEVPVVHRDAVRRYFTSLGTTADDAAVPARGITADDAAVPAPAEPPKEER